MANLSQGFDAGGRHLDCVEALSTSLPAGRGVGVQRRRLRMGAEAAQPPQKAALALVGDVQP